MRPYSTPSVMMIWGTLFSVWNTFSGCGILNIMKCVYLFIFDWHCLSVTWKNEVFIFICSLNEWNLIYHSWAFTIIFRLQNVKSPQKKQGPTPERGHPKKRHHTDFSARDTGEDHDAVSSGGSTIILHETSASSSDDDHGSCEWKWSVGSMLILHAMVYYRLWYFTVQFWLGRYCDRFVICFH